MTKIRMTGPLSERLRGMWALNRIGARTYIRHALGQRMAPDWDANFEVGIRFWRHQFTRAMAQRDMARGRAVLDSVLTETDDVYAVRERACEGFEGLWFEPEERRSGAVLLYFHGGGYTFRGAMMPRFAAMLAHHTGARVFMPFYRLTPEHPHPAQAEDALAAWRYLAGQVPARQVVVIGDSAGGHMALMLLLGLRNAGLEQPALCIGLCPWTDIGARGDSLRGNDRFDLVQGWMAVRFGEWLDPEGRYGREALSPVAQDFRGLAPLYVQAGGREVLRDMIVDFAQAQAWNGASVMLDLWPDMPHDFQSFDGVKASSGQALARISAAVGAYVDGKGALGPCAWTVVG